jgi:hypothetical protein
LLLSICLVACGTSLSQAARERGATDLDCPAEFVSAYRASGGVYVAQGCEKWVRYACVPSGDHPACIPDSEPGS